MYKNRIVSYFCCILRIVSERIVSDFGGLRIVSYRIVSFCREYRIVSDFEYRIFVWYLIVSYRIGFLVLPDGLPRGVSILGPRVAQTRGGDTKWNSGFEKPLVAGVHARSFLFFVKK